MRESLTPWLCSTLSQVAQPLPECYKGATPFGRILFNFFQLPPLPRHPPFCVRVVFSGLQACRFGLPLSYVSGSVSGCVHVPCLNVAFRSLL